jgi:hypothetical protein
LLPTAASLLQMHRANDPDWNSEGLEGFEHRMFECSKCGQTEINVVASDPLKATRWDGCRASLDVDIKGRPVCNATAAIKPSPSKNVYVA